MSIQNIFREYWLSLTVSEEALFRKFLVLFLEYNAHTNLSAIRDEAGVAEKHFVDSLVLERFLRIDNQKILDIGSGGGFPGIPLAIRHPEAQFVLLDSVGKKVRAMTHFSEALGLRNVRAIQGRAEEIATSSLRGAQRRGNLITNVAWTQQDRHASLHSARDDEFSNGFDLVVSRATAYLPQILEWAAPFLSQSGQIVLYKLPSDDELRDGMVMAKKLSLKLSRQEKYTLAGQERVLLFFVRR